MDESDLNESSPPPPDSDNPLSESKPFRLDGRTLAAIIAATIAMFTWTATEVIAMVRNDTQQSARIETLEKRVDKIEALAIESVQQRARLLEMAEENKRATARIEESTRETQRSLEDHERYTRQHLSRKPTE